MRHVPVAQPQTMIGFLRSIGGLRFCTELTRRDARAVWPGLVNDKRGKSLDYGREAAEEAGFIEPFSSVSDFLDALDAHPHYRKNDVARLVAWQDQGRVFDPSAHSEEAPVAYCSETAVEFADPDFDQFVSQTQSALPKSQSLRKLGFMIEPVKDRSADARAWRKSLKLTQAELAERTGYSKRMVESFEKGGFSTKDGLTPIPESSWLTYSLVCAAIGSEAKVPF